MRVKVSSDVEKGSQQLVVPRVLDMSRAKILHRSGPVNISQQAGVTEAERLYRLAGWKVKNVFQGSLIAAQPLHLAAAQHRSGKQDRQEDASYQSSFAASI